MDSDLQAQLFLKTYPCSGSCVIGIPTGLTKRTIHGEDKAVFSYDNKKRPPTIEDAINHLLGRKSLVLNPLMPNGYCLWCAADKDHIKYADFTIPDWAKPIANFYPSKSGWIHVVVVFARPWPASSAQRVIRGVMRKLGLETDEIFPRHTIQNAPPQGCFVNMPFFGARVVGKIVKYDLPTEALWAPEANTDTLAANGSLGACEQATPDDPNEAGCWWSDALLAMLQAYKEFIPGFDFKKCRRGYAVPCPGNPKLGGWPDGAKHSTTDPLVSHEALVFVRNGYPKFRCVHAHCDLPRPDKKTINDWRDFWDPGYVFFDIDSWLDTWAEAQ
jgi:hypothetical protein